MHAAQEGFGQRVPIVSDRFHVAKLDRSRLERLRKQELKRLKPTLSEEAYGQLTGAMWALCKKEEQLAEKDKDIRAC